MLRTGTPKNSLSASIWHVGRSILQPGLPGLSTRPGGKTGRQREDAGVQIPNARTCEETAKLIAVHNLSEAQCFLLLRAGGFAMPSIAVIRANGCMTDTVIYLLCSGRKPLTPRTTATRYTAGTPGRLLSEIQYEIGYDEVDGIRKKVKAIVGDELYRMLNSPFDEDNLRQEANRNRGDFGNVSTEPLLIATYLKSIDEQANIVKNVPAFSDSFDNDTHDLIDKRSTMG